jgi:membrane protein
MSVRLPRKAKTAVRIVRAVLDELQEKKVPFMTGSIAYSAFVSLLPLVVLLLVVASALGGERLVNSVRSVTESYLSPTGQSLLAESISQADAQTGVSVLGLVVLIWGVLRVFRALDTAFSAIYETQRKNDLLDRFKDGLVVLLSLGIALLSVLVMGFALRLLPDLPFPRVLSELLLVVGLSIVFVPMYYVFPDVDLPIRNVIPGAVVAAVGWTILKAVFGIYVAYSSTQDLYGVIGGVILLITWLYLGALVILIGAVTNVVLMGGRSGGSSGGSSEIPGPR